MPKTKNEFNYDKYKIESEPNGDMRISIPVSTLPRQMSKAMGYSGNNPYRAYQRMAKIRITAIYTNEAEEEMSFSEDLKIIQVRRMVNPKGIYRSHDNNSSFHVRLKSQLFESDDKYSDYRSMGPWMARIIYQNNASKDFITLEGEKIKFKDPQVWNAPEQTVVGGYTGSFIDFNVKFNGTLPSDQVKCAVIEVRYNNFSCSHNILVRQGYAPILLSDKKMTKDLSFENSKFRVDFTPRKWATFNLRTKDKFVDNPLDEGSFFRFGKIDYPIESSVLGYDKDPWLDIVPADFKSRDPLIPNDTKDHYLKRDKSKDAKFLLADGKTKMTWDEIGYEDFGSGEFKSIEINGETYYPAGFNDYMALKYADGMEEAFGVCYADNSTSNSSRYFVGTGYTAKKNSNGYGMKGVFAYQTEAGNCQGNNVFFPVGHTGFGRIKHYDGNGYRVLRYAGANNYITSHSRPLLYPLFRMDGAVYWLNKNTPYGKGAKAIGWDMNYIVLDFNPYNDTNAMTGSDNTEYHWKENSIKTAYLDKDNNMVITKANLQNNNYHIDNDGYVRQADGTFANLKNSDGSYKIVAKVSEHKSDALFIRYVVGNDYGETKPSN